MAARFGAPDLTEEEVARLQDVIESTGAKAQVEAAITSLVDAAMEALSSLPLEPEAVSALGEIGAFVAGRDF
jgi:geranylgeranyl diphosphate synthase type I